MNGLDGLSLRRKWEWALGFISLTLVFSILFENSARADFFKYQYEFKNGTRILYLEKETDGYHPGLFVIKKDEELAVPLESEPKSAEGSGNLWLMESTNVPASESHEMIQLLKATGKAKMAFFGIGTRLIAINEDMKFTDLLDFNKVLKDHPDLHIEVLTAPETASDGATSVRALEVRYTVPAKDGGYHISIERALVDQDFTLIPLPRTEVSVSDLISLPSIFSLGKTWGERGKILTLDHLGFNQEQLSQVRSQLYFSDLHSARNRIQDFPLATWNYVHDLEKSRHFRTNYAHESFFDYSLRVFGDQPSPKPIYQKLIHDLSNLILPETLGSLQSVQLRTHGDLLTALSFFSYHEASSEFHDLPKTGLRGLPLVEYSRFSGVPNDSELDRYFEEIDQIRKFANHQPIVLLVPGQEAGAFRIHIINKSNVGKLTEMMKADFSPCDSLSK